MPYAVPYRMPYAVPYRTPYAVRCTLLYQRFFFSAFSHDIPCRCFLATPSSFARTKHNIRCDVTYSRGKPSSLPRPEVKVSPRHMLVTAINPLWSQRADSLAAGVCVPVGVGRWRIVFSFFSPPPRRIAVDLYASSGNTRGRGFTRQRVHASTSPRVNESDRLGLISILFPDALCVNCLALFA